MVGTDLRRSHGCIRSRSRSLRAALGLRPDRHPGAGRQRLDCSADRGHGRTTDPDRPVVRRCRCGSGRHGRAPYPAQPRATAAACRRRSATARVPALSGPGDRIFRDPWRVRARRPRTSTPASPGLAGTALPPRCSSPSTSPKPVESASSGAGVWRSHHGDPAGAPLRPHWLGPRPEASDPQGAHDPVEVGVVDPAAGLGPGAGALEREPAAISRQLLTRPTSALLDQTTLPSVSRPPESQACADPSVGCPANGSYRAA